MSEPTRLRDEGPDPLRALLRNAPRTRSMSVDEHARTRARVGRFAASLAVGAGSLAWFQGAAIGAGLGLLAVGAAEELPALLSPPSSIAPAAIRSSPGGLGSKSPLSARPAPAVSPPPPPAEPPSSPASSAAIEPPSPRSVRPAAEPVPKAAEPLSETDSLAQEAALLERARAALGPTPAAALELTEVHASRFPRGKLGMERELIALEALRRLGRAEEARTRGEALLARAKGGLYEARIRQLVSGAP